MRRDEKSSEGVGSGVDLDQKPAVGQGLDDKVRNGREVGSALPVGEQVHVATWTVTHAVGSDRITTGQCEAVVATGGAEGDLGELPVTWIHAGEPYAAAALEPVRGRSGKRPSHARRRSTGSQSVGHS